MKNQTTPIQGRKNQAQRGQSSQTIAGGFIEHILKPSNQQSYVSLVSLVINWSSKTAKIHTHTHTRHTKTAVRSEEAKTPPRQQQKTQKREREREERAPGRAREREGRERVVGARVGPPGRFYSLFPVSMYFRILRLILVFRKLVDTVVFCVYVLVVGRRRKKKRGK